MPLISESRAFAPTAPMLALALDDLRRLEPGSGAVERDVRRAALASYQRFGPERNTLARRTRHDYAKLSSDDVRWSTGRVRVPDAPLRASANGGGRPRTDDRPALAVDNAGGLVHVGSTYLEPAVRPGDPRVTLCALADARTAEPAAVGALAHTIVRPDFDRFTALATAFENCGAYVAIPDGVVLDAPLQIVWSARPGQVAAVFPHTVVRLGAGARATIVERHVGDTEAFVAGIVEVDLAAGARLDYVVVQQADEGARLFFTRAARCAADAAIAWHVADFGGALVRGTLEARLEGPRSHAEIDALFFAAEFTHVDNAVRAEHLAEYTSSHTVVRSAAKDRGRGRFAGAIRIAPEARFSTASLRNDCLVLSRDAYLETVPSLEIGSKDVSAQHAATVGSLDKEELFYVQSRGIARERAERMIALAFFEPAIVRFPSDALRDEVRTVLDSRLDEVPETFAS